MYILYSIILILISMIEYMSTSDNRILSFGNVLNRMSLLCLVTCEERVLKSFRFMSNCVSIALHLLSLVTQYLSSFVMLPRKRNKQRRLYIKYCNHHHHHHQSTVCQYIQIGYRNYVSLFQSIQIQASSNKLQFPGYDLLATSIHVCLGVYINFT